MYEDVIEFFKNLMLLCNELTKNTDFHLTNSSRYYVGSYIFYLDYGSKTLNVGYSTNTSDIKTSLLTVFIEYPTTTCAIASNGLYGGHCYQTTKTHPIVFGVKHHEDDEDIKSQFVEKLNPFVLTEEEYFQYSTIFELQSYEFYKEWSFVLKNTPIKEGIMAYWNYRDDLPVHLIGDLIVELRGQHA